MLDQYWRLKGQHPEALLFFRLGDFYELFEKDAELAAPLLDLQLTSRDGRIAMCGVPYHAGLQHARRLLDLGFTVAIAEQVEDPATAKGLMDRQIVRVLTPGTIIPDDDEGSPRVGVVYRHRQGLVAVVAELSTGTMHIAESGTASEDRRTMAQWWTTWRVNEYLTNTDEAWLIRGVRIDGASYFRKTDALRNKRLLQDKLGLSGLRRWGLEDRTAVHEALAALARYLQQLQPVTLRHLKDIRLHELKSQMRLSARSLEQLDISGSPANLMTWLDSCRTKMGSRRLGEWLEHPSTDPRVIHKRHQAVAHWVDHALEREQVRDRLSRVGDLSRRVSRLVMGLGTPRDVEGVYLALQVLPELWPIHESQIWAAPSTLGPSLWTTLTKNLNVIHHPASVKWDETPLIAEGADPDIDRARQLVHKHRQTLLELEDSERQRSGLKSLRVGFHRTFGYYLEVTKSQAKQVPPDWRRRQTTTHTERFISDGLRELETAIEEAEERVNQAEKRWAERLQILVVEHSEWLIDVAAWISEIDVLCAMAEAAVKYRLAAPQLGTTDSPIHLSGLRHPVLESLVEEYVQSDLQLLSPHATLIITGPNMGGKSTFMRALAQNVVLAQSGSWVACNQYQAPIFDAVLTRVGADDDLLRGQSTFMVEMEEVAAILQQSTSQSLVLLDELGRGTSTYDGMAIAQAVIERLADKDGPLTLCATHYHELTELAENSPYVVNLTVEVLDGPEGPIFTHRIIPGRASQSYGLEVARQAGLPSSVIRRAQLHLKYWETQADSTPEKESQQITFQNPDPVGGALVAALRDLQPDDLSPREAWLFLSDWKDRLTREGF